MKISDFTKEQLQFFLDNEKKIKKEMQSKKYNIGDCFILFNGYHDLNIFKITSSYKRYYKCIHIYNSFTDSFNIEKWDRNDKDLDSYIKINSSLYDSIESFIQKYNQRRTTDYKQLDAKYHKEIYDYIENLKQSFKITL